MKIYVGNISRESTENEIRDAFAEFGEVTDITLIRDNYTKVLKGFGFIEMPDKEAGEKAIKELDGQLFNGRPLTVNVAKPKTESGNRSGGGGGHDRRPRRNY
jgi:RNA recognition motif-containing protein